MPELTEQIAASFLARHGEDGLWLQIIEVAARVMAARELMVARCEGENDLIEGLARLELLLEVASLTSVGSISFCLNTDPDAWAYPGLMLSRLIMTTSWWLRRRRTADELASAMNDAKCAMICVARPMRERVDQSRAKIVNEIC
jgi:hypothetical protein